MNTVRAGLMALLPVMALAVYIDGQRYDPDIFRFKPGAPAGLSHLAPLQAAGLSLDGAPRVYNKDNLFEIVNGHAEFFISLGFKSLTVAGYLPEGSGPGKPEYTLDIYDMGQARNAFGALIQESGGMDPFPAGALGFGSSRTIMFMKGGLYVKVDSFGKSEKLRDLAREIASALPVEMDGLPQFALFPPEGALPDRRSYKRKDYMGIEFLSDVFEQEYLQGGQSFFAFAFTPEEEMEAFSQRALDWLHAMDIEAERTELAGVPVILVNDKYEGAWGMALYQGKALGVRGFQTQEPARLFLESFIAKASQP